MFGRFFGGDSAAAKHPAKHPVKPSGGSQFVLDPSLFIDEPLDLDLGDDAVGDEVEIDDPHLLAELRALTVTDGGEKPAGTKQVAAASRNTSKVTSPPPEFVVDTASLLQDEVHVADVTDDELNSVHLLRELYEVTGHVEENAVESPHDETTQIQVALETVAVSVEPDSLAVMSSDIASDDELPLEFRLKSSDTALLEKYIRLEKVKAATKSRAGDKTGARASMSAYKQLEQRLAELQQPAKSQSIPDLPSAPMTAATASNVADQITQLKRTALAHKKANNMAAAREALMQAKLLQESTAASTVETAPLSPVAKKAPTANQKKPVPEIPKETDDFQVISPTEDPAKVFTQIVAQLNKQIATCTTIAGQYLKTGNKELALKFHQYKKSFVADLASLESLRLAEIKKSQHPAVPKFHYTSVSYSIEKGFPQLSMQDLQLQIVRGIALCCKDVAAQDLDTYVSWDLGWPTEGANVALGRGDTPFTKRSMDPEYGFEKVVKIDRTKSFQRFLERKKATFEVFHNRGFLRKPVSLGRAIVKLEPLLEHSEIDDCFELLDANTRKASGAKLEVRLRMRQPLLKADITTCTETWLIVDDFNPEAYRGLSSAPSPPSKPAATTTITAPIIPVTSPPPSKPAATTTITAPIIPVTSPRQRASVTAPTKPKTPPATAASTTAPIAAEVEDLVAQFENVDLLVSNNVLEAELAQVDQTMLQLQQKRSPVPEDLTDRKTQIGIKIQLLMLQVQSGRLTMEMYLTMVKKAAAETKAMALQFKKLQRLDFAKRTLLRAKIMDDEVAEAEASMSE